MSTADFVSRSNVVHNHKYTYNDTHYTKSKHKVNITCPEHGPFEQRAESHLDGRGCPKCFNTGYSGRCGIYELMIINDKLKKQITKNLDISQIRSSLAKQYKNLRQNSIDLIENGITTISEVIRVTKNI